MGITMAVPPLEIVSYPLWEAIPYGVQHTVDVALQIFTGFRRLAQGTAPADSIGGPARIGQLTGQFCQQGPLQCMEFTALLSVNLAIINLFPFPALDGGRLMFVLIEMLRGGRRVAPEKEAIVHLLGMVFLLMLMVVITFFDVQRLFGGG